MQRLKKFCNFLPHFLLGGHVELHCFTCFGSHTQFGDLFTGVGTKIMSPKNRQTPCWKWSNL